MTNEDDRRLTPAEAGEYLGISQDAVYELCKGESPEITHYRIGKKRNRIAIPMSALKDYDRRTLVPAVASLEEHRLRSRTAA